MTYSTPQEEFWAGSSGDKYVGRNEGQKLIASKVAMFARILSKTTGVHSAIEFGANIGLNMLALKTLLPDIELRAIEINQEAFNRLERIEGVSATLGSILDFEDENVSDIAFTAGVLIHMNPDMIGRVYEKLYRAARRYVLMAEYYNPQPVEMNYRGHSGRLFKRDWAGEMMQAYRDLKLVDYRFVYHLDPVFPGDDVTWFLLKKDKSP